MTRSAGKTLYALFGLAPSASQAQIDANYAALQKQLADLVDPLQRRQRLAQLDEAYLLLSNPLRRKVYDASLQAGQAKLVELDQARPVGTASDKPRGDNRSLWIIGLVVLSLFAFGYLYLAWRQQKTVESYRSSFETAQQRSLQAQQAMEARQSEVMEAERTANGYPDKTSAERDAERQARQDSERREREYEQWGDKVANEQQRAQYEAERKERQRQQEREYEARAAQAQQANDQREAVARVEHERQQQLNKLINEKRYDEARSLAKSEYEFDRIKSAEKYGH